MSDITLRNLPPGSTAEAGGAQFLLGTDPLGRDMLSRLIIGARVSLVVSAASVLLSGVFGTAAGVIAGYYRGRVDDIIMRFADLQMSLPSLLISLFVLYAIGPSFLSVVLVLAATRWMLYARVSRSVVLSLREQPFVEAARAMGAGDLRIMGRHVLPNALAPVATLAALELPTMLLYEAALDFLGLGIQPPETSWGLMLAEGREYLTSAWWLVAFPGLAIFLTALSLNLTARQRRPRA